MTDTTEEPKLSYERILNDLANITTTDSITSSCLHNKIFAVGTLYGRIYLFDHQGNKVDGQQLYVHLKPVNCISIDEKGEYLVSCSDDQLAVYGLLNGEHNLVMMLDKPMNVVAIDPYFYRPGGGRRFVAGDDKVVLYEKGFLPFKSKYRSTILQSKEQKVRSLSWHGQFIAWATDAAVQIFDVEQRAIITRIKRDNEGLDKCQFCWKDDRTLLIGWNNTVKVCLIKERSHEIQKELPRKYVEIVSMLETDFTICGLAPFNKSLLSLSFNKDEETKPQVYILETFANSYNELSKDILTPQCSKTFPLSLLSLHQDGIYFIVCPKDVISAKPCDSDDHIDWLIQHSMLKECCSFAKNCSSELNRHSVKEIEELYMKELLETGTNESYSEAASLCASICDKNQKLWNEAIEKFCNLGQLKHLLPYLPKNLEKFSLNLDSFNFITNQRVFKE